MTLLWWFVLAKMKELQTFPKRHYEISQWKKNTIAGHLLSDQAVSQQ